MESAEYLPLLPFSANFFFLCPRFPLQQIIVCLLQVNLELTLNIKENSFLSVPPSLRPLPLRSARPGPGQPRTPKILAGIEAGTRRGTESSLTTLTAPSVTAGGGIFLSRGVRRLAVDSARL